MRFIVILSTIYRIAEEFYWHFTSDELDLVNSFNKPVGFFDFLYDSRLYGKHESANRTLAECALNIWQSHNETVINMD